MRETIENKWWFLPWLLSSYLHVITLWLFYENVSAKEVVNFSSKSSNRFHSLKSSVFPQNFLGFLFEIKRGK